MSAHMCISRPCPICQRVSGPVEYRFTDPHAPDLSVLDQAVIDAATKFEADPMGPGHRRQLDMAVRARRAALAPPPVERKRWTIETEERDPRKAEAYIYTSGGSERQIIVYPDDSQPRHDIAPWRRHVIVSVEPQ